MIKKLQLVVLGLIVSQGICLNAMDKTTNSPRPVLSRSVEGRKHPVEADKVEKGVKRQCLNLSAPSYIVEEKRDWAVELKKNPRLAWLPI
jgi:hypothetical protein